MNERPVEAVNARVSNIVEHSNQMRKAHGEGVIYVSLPFQYMSVGTKIVEMLEPRNNKYTRTLTICSG